MRCLSVFIPSRLASVVVPFAVTAMMLVSLGSISPEARAQVAQDAKPWWSQAVEAAVQRAGDNRAQLRLALRTVPTANRADLAFLLEHMPAKDLRSLSSAFLLTNIKEAHVALASAPWGQAIPRSVFLNDVLPYAHVSESRESWRASFRERFWPLVEGCKTPGEAAQKLNQSIFRTLGVKYSTRRKRADQSPSESMESGLASCTGLSILLADACRAVGVPARLAGIKSWVNKRGNHTWVEVWDGDWHFTGAAEWDPKGLDRGWFQADAAKAIANDPNHAIYAVSYRKTGERFPMVWARGADPIAGVNVTSRYTRKKRGPATGQARVMVRVVDSQGVRRAVPVVVVRKRDQKVVFRGQSKAETRDTNDFLTFDLPRDGVFEISVTGAPVRVFKPTAAAEQLVEVTLGRAAADDSIVSEGKLAATPDKLYRAAARWFRGPSKKAGNRSPRTAGAEFRRLDKLVAQDEAAARAAVWRAYRESSAHDSARADFAAKRVRSGAHESPYTLKYVGKKPGGGWPLFVAMHGGGGVAKRVNDSQWRHMQIYYRDQKSVPGYAYVALRAPNDRWNGFYDHYVWPLVEGLVRQFLVCDEINPDKVFLMGYSHGGYGAFAIGPHLADRFAWVHASAAAPTPGFSPAENLRNLRFTYMVGERDTRYGRLDRCRKFDVALQKLRTPSTNEYNVTFEFKKGYGHGGLPDRNKISEMYPAARTHSPKAVSWRPTGSGVPHFYWLQDPAGARGQTLEARIVGNVITITTAKVPALTLWLDQRLVDLGQPVIVEWNGTRRRFNRKPSFAVLCTSMSERGDPSLARTVRIDLKNK